MASKISSKIIISILDLKLGNVKSLSSCLDYLGIKYKIIFTPADVVKSDFLVIPGVGSFDYAMGLLKKKKLIESIKIHTLIKKKIILGICIGMQIFFSSSEEGKMKGLNFFSNKLYKLKKNDTFKVPNVGYNPIFGFKKNGIFSNFNKDLSFYFTNSYALKNFSPKDFENYCLTKHKFNYIAAFQKQNIIGLQFHPELSHSSGMLVLKNIYTKLL